MTVIPSIESRWIFVASNDRVRLAAEAASWITDTKKYVAYFEFPSLEYPYTGSTDFGTDGYIARALGDRAATLINNAVARIQPNLIVLLGINENSASYLRARLPHEMLVEVSAIEELGTALNFYPSFHGNVLCRPAELMRGLALAKSEQKRLVVSESAKSLPLFIRLGGVGLLAVEEENEVSEIAAVNLALSAQLDLIFLPVIQRDDLSNLPRDLHDWSSNPSHQAFHDWKRRVRNALRAVPIRTYEQITFFTTGLPYGLFLENAVRCCHVQKYRDTSDAIVNAILEEDSPTSFGSALLFSPELFASEETNELARLLEARRFRTKMLLGKEATVRNLSNFGSHYPYDLLHICSHGGQTDGYFTIRNFQDREGKMHTAEYYEVVGFAPTGGDLVQVTSKLIFHKLDGHRWMSPPLDAFPKHVFEDMLQSIKSEADVNRIPYRSPIARSCHIQCHSSIHQGHFSQLAGFGHPVVFNNTCASSHELEVSFLHAGARAYIGTLWNVGNETAKEAAIMFYRALEANANLSCAVHHIVQNISVKKYQNVYVYWGFHFSTFHLSRLHGEDAILSALMLLWRIWMQKASTTLDQEVKANCLPVIRFLTEEILSELEAHHFKGFEDFEPTAVSEIERSVASRERSFILQDEEWSFEDGLGA